MAEREPLSIKPPQSKEEKAYQALFDEYLGPVSGLAVLVIAIALYRLPYPLAEQAGVNLAINREEQELMNPAIAGILARLKLAENVKKTILNSGDYLGLTLGLGLYATRVMSTLSAIRQQLQQGGENNVTGQQATSAAQQANNGATRAGVFAGYSEYRAD